MDKLEHVNYDQGRSIAENFIKSRATLDDIDKLEDLIDIRKKMLVDFTCGDGSRE